MFMLQLLTGFDLEALPLKKKKVCAVFYFTKLPHERNNKPSVVTGSE